jgi:hypothetical protein
MIWSEMMASDTSPYPWVRVADGITETHGARFATKEEAVASLVASSNYLYRIVNTDTGETVIFEEEGEL